MLRESLRSSFHHVGVALREPEAFALRWDREAPYALVVWVALGLTAAVGTMVYGMTMGLGSGGQVILTKGVLLTIAAGAAWGAALPALYVLNSLSGSRLRASTTLLAALVTTSWGGLAMLASVPINWFFSVAIPAQASGLLGTRVAEVLVVAVSGVVFAGVGLSMVDVFRRVMRALEPENDVEPVWFLVLVGAIGSQLIYLFGLFSV